MVLNLEQVSLKKEGKWILNQINWKINKGEHWVLLGLNGAGKTALLHMLCAYYFPTSGKVNVVGKQFGQDILGEKLRQQIGIVSSTIKGKIYGTDSAYQVVLSGAFASIGLYEEPTDEMREQAQQILRDLDCFHYANRSFRSLSQGEQQRVLIGRALMGNPPLLILDEPTNGLDFIAKEKLLESIERIASNGGPTIIYVTHHVEEILPVFNKTLLLREGTVFAKGDSKEIITSTNLSDFFGMKVEVNWSEERPSLKKVK
ncbi:iron complex transport system ATP-binding protein [Gracilibacillus ureilyticus]|uniref:Iron complex transport system ATP-binding protein n=1 Tax=Gracilibacillus ureilyticus TaxID=531814 RepID=A0A1H9NKZ0_9BACI|nr:ABC transporter ATP-binding protein [Gracilibacillus ureilyticus]SER36562.1 iron complex transport system ATP-binding protein [Gracilibacillus ureilyticus]